MDLKRVAPVLAVLGALISVPGHAQAATWTSRLHMVRRFAIWLSASDRRTEVPAAGLLTHRYRRKRPYIYSDAQIKKLIQSRVMELYHQKEVEFPVKLGMARFMSDRPVVHGAGARYDREGLFRWAQGRFGTIAPCAGFLPSVPALTTCSNAACSTRCVYRMLEIPTPRLNSLSYK
jgi:hypothetical protein